MDNTTTHTDLSFEQIAAAKGVDLNYELTRGFTARYIRRKAAQLVGKTRLTGSHRDDVEQDLTIRLLRRLPKFDPRRRPWPVFVKVVIDKHVATLLETRRTKKREHIQNIVSLSELVAGEDGEQEELGRQIGPEQKENLIGRYASSDLERSELTHDVQAVLATLPDDLRDLCARLQTDSLTQVARDLGVPRSTLREQVQRLRQIFEQAGLRSFL
jgi:RNA polymerase sigma-70 factor (ECF subfamily)